MLDDRQRSNFWAKVEKESTGCWLWTGGLDIHGYGKVQLWRRTHGAHRISWEMVNGPVPEGQHLDHLCRVRKCVNPSHLEPVTPRTNLLRGDTIAAANAAKTHCDNGHAFDAANTYIRPNGNRACKECRRATNREWMRSYKHSRSRVVRPS